MMVVCLGRWPLRLQASHSREPLAPTRRFNRSPCHGFRPASAHPNPENLICTTII